jgi:kumamolisin
MGSKFIALPGSMRLAPSSWNDLPPWALDERVEISVRVRRRAGVEHHLKRLGDLPLRDRVHVSRERFAAAFGADLDALAAVELHARERRIEVTDVCPARRRVLLSGTLGALLETFPTDVRRAEHRGAPHRLRCGPQHVDASLEGHVEAVFGFCGHPRARPYVRLPARVAPSPEGDRASAISYLPGEIANFYDFPAGLDGSGQCIGILEFGGGYSDDDLRQYFAKIGVACPEFVAVEVGSQRNRPGVAPGYDAEVALDLEVAGAVAPGARFAVYFSEWTEKGWVDAIEAAVHDRENRPSILSISWGWAELEAAGGVAWTQAAVDAVSSALKDAALLGITVVCAAGDDGSEDGIGGGHAHVDFPASSPFVLGCGGTALRVAGGALLDERVWNDGARTEIGGGTTGGGVSALVPMPEWQASAGVPLSVATGLPGRGVPDVAGDAAQATGYTIRVGGQDLCGVGGTSAVAPLYAGLIARINQKLGRPAGYLNPLLYKLAPRVFRDVTEGHNDSAGAKGYAAREGWDACTGWGSIVGSKLLAALLEEETAPTQTTPPPGEEHQVEVGMPRVAALPKAG